MGSASRSGAGALLGGALAGAVESGLDSRVSMRLIVVATDGTGMQADAILGVLSAAAPRALPPTSRTAASELRRLAGRA